jgi:hypothetical protein
VARSYGRVFPSIWNDDDFRALSMEARLMYLFLLSQTDLDHAGLIPLRVRRWARSLGLDAKEVTELCAELDEARFTATDADTEELLVRSLIRRDGVWKQPNVFRSAASAAAGCESARLKGEILAEARRLDVSEASNDIRQIRQEMLAALEPFGNPSPTPPRPSREPSAGRNLAVVAPPEPDSSAETGNSAGHKGSVRVAEGFAKSTGEPWGKGKGSPVGKTPPLSPTPAPSPPTPPPLWDAESAPGPGPQEGEGDSGERTPRAAAALADEIRAIRPEWSTRSIRRAIDHPDVRERPWPAVRAAFAIVARDPESRHPGRLAHDGGWWPAAARRTGPVAAVPDGDRPGWCGDCDRRTRFLLDEFGQPGLLKCPRCHPEAQRARSA